MEECLAAFTHTLLDRGKVTPFHTITLLDRYDELYTALSAEVRPCGIFSARQMLENNSFPG